MTYLDQNQSHFLTNDFTIEELELTLKFQRDTSPEFDHISYSMIKNILWELIELISIFNYIYQSQDILNTWKTQIIVPNLKPGKMPNKPSSYQLIVLNCYLEKIFKIFKS